MKILQWWNDADGENRKYSYRNLSQCYLTTWHSNRTACHWTRASAVKGRKSVAWTMAGIDQTQISWDVTSPLISLTPQNTAPLWETETSQILHSFLSISDISLAAFCLSLFCLLFPSFPSSHLPPPHKCHICAHKSLIPLLASVSQLTPSYWLLLWRHEHLICGCPSLIAMIMARLCAWVDWACWLGMLIDPQNINTTVHIFKYSDSNKELGPRIRKRFGTWMFAVLFAQNHTFPYRLIPNPEFPIACSENSCTQNRIRINPINENGWNRK